MGEGRDHDHRRNKIRGLGWSAVLEKGKDSQLGVPRRQVAYKLVSHQAVEEHRWTACKTPGAQVFSREGSWPSPYTCVATACASFATTPHLNSAFLPAGLPACTTKVLPQGWEATHLHLIVWFSASPTIQLFLMDTFPPFPPYTFLLSQILFLFYPRAYPTIAGL